MATAMRTSCGIMKDQKSWRCGKLVRCSDCVWGALLWPSGSWLLRKQTWGTENTFFCELISRVDDRDCKRYHSLLLDVSTNCLLCPYKNQGFVGNNASSTEPSTCRAYVKLLSPLLLVSVVCSHKKQVSSCFDPALRQIYGLKIGRHKVVFSLSWPWMFATLQVLLEMFSWFQCSAGFQRLQRDVNLMDLSIPFTAALSRAIKVTHEVVIFSFVSPLKSSRAVELLISFMTHDSFLLDCNLISLSPKALTLWEHKIYVIISSTP